MVANETCVTTQHNTSWESFLKMLGGPCNYNGLRNLACIVVGREPSSINLNLSLQREILGLLQLLGSLNSHTEELTIHMSSFKPLMVPLTTLLHPLLLDIHSWCHGHLCAQLAACLFRHQARLIYCIEYCMADCRTTFH